MKVYYGFPPESQRDHLKSIAEIHADSRCENECFATFPANENRPQTPEAPGVAHVLGDGGLVYANNRPPTPKPGYLTLVASECQKIAADQQQKPPRGRHAKNSAKAMKAAHKKTKAWARLSSDDRQRRTLDFAFRSESLAFSLNLTPKKQAQLRKADRPAKRLADEIQRACRRELDRAVPISLALEVTATGRLHAHGIVTLERREGTAFTKALKSAGGQVLGSGAGRQTDLRRLWSATGWADYIAKAFDQTAAALGTDKIVYQCRATVAGSREEYEVSLVRQKALRKTQREPVSRHDKQILIYCNYMIVNTNF